MYGRKRIKVELAGGLGNQLFQLAFGVAMSQSFKAKLVLDATAYTLHAQRRLVIDWFKIPTTIQIKTSRGLFERYVQSRLPKGFRLWLSGQTYLERSYCHDPSVLQLKPPLCFRGYWQSPRYFDGYTQLLRAYIVPAFSLSLPAKKLLGSDSLSQSCAIHVRRGDYAANPAVQNYHGLCTAEYYEKAVQVLRQKGIRDFVVFTDDVAWVSKNLFSAEQFRYVTLEGPNSDLEEFWLMSRCGHQITANSSYSWWAAWLNPNPDKIVVMPSPWFANQELDASDLYPDYALKIPSGIVPS